MRLLAFLGLAVLTVTHPAQAMECAEEIGETMLYVIARLVMGF